METGRRRDTFINRFKLAECMRLFAFLLLLSVFAVAACTVEEISAVTLTPSEQGDLTVAELGLLEKTLLSLDANPGYVSPEFLSVIAPDANSTHVAIYSTEENSKILIFTTVSKSGNIEETLKSLDLNQDPEDGETGGIIYLIKGKTLTTIGYSNEGDAELAEEIANKVAQRLGMKIVRLDGLA